MGRGPILMVLGLDEDSIQGGRTLNGGTYQLGGVDDVLALARREPYGPDDGEDLGGKINMKGFRGYNEGRLASRSLICIYTCTVGMYLLIGQRGECLRGRGEAEELRRDLVHLAIRCLGAENLKCISG